MKKTALNLALVVVLQGCSGEGLLPTRTSVDTSPPVQVVTLPQPQPDEIVGKRLALIIGNGEYSEIGRLKNTLNDAEDMRKTLKELQFDVIFVRDVKDKREMKDAVRQFGEKLKGSNIGLFYYSGHGMQIDGRNYLIPIKADLKSKADVESETLEANYVLQLMEEAKNDVNIVILDACRNNPFSRGFRDVQMGLAKMNNPENPKGSLIAFSTAPGAVAEDGTDRNGTYTKHLLRYLKTPGLTIEEMFKQVRSLVQDETKQRRTSQTPWEQSSLVGKLCLAGCENTQNSAQQAILKKNLEEQEQARLKLEQTLKQREAEFAEIKAQRDAILKDTSGASEQTRQQLKLLEQEKQRLETEKIGLEQQKKKLDQQHSDMRKLNSNTEKPQETFFVPMH